MRHGNGEKSLLKPILENQDLEDRLLNNHLAFLTSHRGTVLRDGDLVHIESERSEFTYAILRRSAVLRALPAITKSVQHFPSSQITPGELKEAGFAQTMGLSYMILGDDSHWHVRDDLIITHVRKQTEMDAFSEVQSRGFCETEETFRLWHPWLKAANDRNLNNPDQMFYVGQLAEEPVGTALTVFDGDTAGLYAVATLPQHRKKRISTTVMHRAIHDAKMRMRDFIILQVKQDSQVEQFYSRLGFRRCFTTGLYSRV